MKDFFNGATGIPLSTGGICYMLQRLTTKAVPVYKQIKQRIALSSVVGADETGCKVNGKTNWFCTWQNPLLTYIAYSVCKGFKTIRQVFENGLPDAVLNHDRWACHFQYNTKHHQICTAHLRRKLNNINVIYLGDWSAHFKFIVTRAIELKNKLNPTDYNFKNTAQQIPESKLYKLLHIKSLNKNKKAITLQKKLANISSCIFYFLYHSKFVSYKKGSESAIRNNEVKQKIYGQFKSVEGAISFAVISSVITAISSGQNVLNALSYGAKIATQ